MDDDDDDDNGGVLAMMMMMMMMKDLLSNIATEYRLGMLFNYECQE